MSKRLRVFLISALAIMLIMTCTVFTVTATNEFKMIDNASIRVSATADGFYGIKFAATVQDTDKNYKMLIIPKDYYEGYLNAADKGEKNVVDYLIGRFGEDKLSIVKNCVLKENTVEGSIVKVKYNNLNRGFLGIAYYETENEGATVYNVAAFATETPKSYTIVEKAAEAYVLDEYQGIDVVLDGLKSIILDGVKQANGVLEANKDTTAATITLAEKTKKVFVGDSFKLAYTPAIATSLATYSGENVTVAADKTITAATVGTSTITADLLGVKDTMELTIVSKDITGLAANGNVISWDAAVGADKYIVTVNGTETEVTTNSYTLTADGIYDISVCAVVGEVKGNTASIEDYIYTEDDISLHNMSDVSFKSLTHESGDITFTPNENTAVRNAATIMLKNQYASGSFLKVGFTAKDTKIHRYTKGLGISFARSTDDADLLGGLYALTFYEFANITIDHMGNAPINYTTDITTQPSHVGKVWYGSAGAVNSLTIGNKYYIAVGYENNLIHVALLDANNNLITAVVWNLIDMQAIDARNSDLPESGYFGIHTHFGEKTNITYEICSLADLLGDNVPETTIAFEDGKISWENMFAEKYLVSVGGAEYTETTLTSMDAEYGIYDVSVKAVVKGQETAAVTKTINYAADKVHLLNMSSATINADHTYNSGSIKFEPSESVKDYRSGASIVLANNFTSGQFIKVGYKAKSNSITYVKDALSISIRRSNIGVDPLTAMYSAVIYNFGSFISLGHGAHNPIYYDNTVNETTNCGKSWVNKTDWATSLTTGDMYYLVAGIDGTGENSVFHIIFLDSTNTILRAASWKYRELTGNKTLPTDGYFAIHVGSAGTTELTYEIGSFSSFIEELPAPTIKASGNTMSWAHTLADKYLVSVNDGEFEETTSTSKTFTEEGIYNVKVKYVIGNQESLETSQSLIVSSEDVKFYNMSNVVVNNNKVPSLTSGDVTFDFVYDSAYVHGSTARSSSAIVLNKPYVTGDFIKVGFVATTNSIADSKLGIGILGTTSRPYDSYAPSRYYVNTTKDGAGLLLGYSENRGTDYVGFNGITKKIVGDISLLSGLTVGQKYYIVVGVEAIDNDKLLTIAILDSTDKVLVAYNVTNSALTAKDADFKEIPNSGHFAIVYYGAVGSTATVDYSFTTRDLVYGKVVVNNAASSTVSFNNKVNTIKLTSNSNASVSNASVISTETPCSNEFLKVGFTAVNTMFSKNNIGIGLRKDTKTTNGQSGYGFISAAYGRGIVMYHGGNKHTTVDNGVGKLVYYDATLGNLLLGRIGDGEGKSSYNAGSLELGKTYYIIAGAVTDELETTFYWSLVDSNDKVLYVISYTATALGATPPASGYINVYSYLTSERTITCEILTESEGMAIINSVAQ